MWTACYPVFCIEFLFLDYCKTAKMNRILAVAILLVSAFAYILAPNIYSFEYCFGVQILFALSAIVVSIMDSRNEKVGFNLLFSLSFFFTNFVYPVYIYPIDPCYSLFRFPFNDNVITKCTALAQETGTLMLHYH